MKPYSMDLRQRVLDACDRGEGTKATAKRFGVSPAWVRRLKQHRRLRDGDIAPRTRGGGGRGAGGRRGRGKPRTVAAGLARGGRRCSRVLDGAGSGLASAAFAGFVKRVLVPALTPGEVAGDGQPLEPQGRGGPGAGR